MPRKRRKPLHACPNCGTALRAEDHYCPHCGQENHDLRVPFKHFAYEFLESLTHFDTKLWNTLKVTFTRPGQLTKDFVEGKRARYVHPVRLYVFTSVIFFALLTWHMDREVEQNRADIVVTDPDDDLRKAHLATILPDSLLGALQTKEQTGELERLNGPYHMLTVPIDKPYYRAIADRLREGNATLIDSMAGLVDLDAYDTVPGTREQLRRAFSHLPDADSLDVCYSIRLNSLTMSFCDRAEEALFKKGDLSDADLDSLLSKKAEKTSWFKRRMIRSLGRLDLSRTEGMQRVAHAIVRAISAIMFILMPFTAVLLLWIFFRGRFYWEHLIFSVHTHTIYFLFFMIILLLALIIPGDWPGWVGSLVALTCLAYLLVSLKRVYGLSWPRTILRTLLMSIPYLLITSLLLVVGLLWGFINL